MRQSPLGAERLRPASDPGADWFGAMRRGDFLAAWQVSDRVLAERVAAGPRWDVPRHEQWVWDGSRLQDRTVLVRCYHGLGDTLQFARFLPPLRQVARETVLWAQPWLVPLLRSMPGIGPILPLHDGEPDVERDVDIEIMELGHALRVAPETLSCQVPYLEVPAAPRLSKRFSIGVMAESGDWDRRRCVPPELVSACLMGGAWDVFSLQPGTPLPGLVDARAPDALTLAARVQALDLVITADTMLAHLAGALGVATWTLLPFNADWRWQDGGRLDSPWYPTMRLFRQPRPGDWQSVLDAVADRLACAR